MGDTKEKGLINILYVSSFGWLRRGGQISLWNLLIRLDRKRFNPVLVCPEEGNLLSSARGRGIATEIVPVPSVKFLRLGAIINSLSMLYRILKRHNIEIVHADDLRQILYFGVLKSFHRFRLIWHIRVSWRNMVLDRIGFHMSDSILCTAGVIADKFRTLRKAKEKVKVVYNALDCDYFRPADPDPDIPIYLKSYIRVLNKSIGTRVKSIANDARECLMTYSWPGNVRELINVLEQSLFKVGREEELTWRHLPDDVKSHKNSLPAMTHASLKTRVEHLEKDIILKALQDFGGNKRKTAQRLGIQRSALYIKLKKYGLE